MSAMLKRVLFLVLSLAGGVWAVLDSGARPLDATLSDLKPGNIQATTESVIPARVAVVRRGHLSRKLRATGTLRSARSSPVACHVPVVLRRHSLRNGSPLGDGEEVADSVIPIAHGVASGDTVIVAGHAARGLNSRIRIENPGEGE